MTRIGVSGDEVFTLAIKDTKAINLQRNNVDAWLDMVGILSEEFRNAEALEILDKALAANPGNQRLLEGKALTLRRSGDAAATEAFLQSLLP